jgi:hypothetical protein
MLIATFGCAEDPSNRELVFGVGHLFGGVADGEVFDIGLSGNLIAL